MAKEDVSSKAEDETEIINEENGADTAATSDGIEDSTADSKKDQKLSGNGRIAKLLGWFKKKSHIVYTLVAVLVIAIGVIGLTDLRYKIVGLVWKSTVSVKVVDSKSKQKLVHAKVVVANQTKYTDNKGSVQFTHVSPGKTNIRVSQVAYADSSSTQKIGFGHVQVSDIALKATGVKVVTEVKNLLSGNIIDGVAIKSGDVHAVTDAKGRAELIFPPSANNTEQTLEYSKDGYNSTTQKIKVHIGSAPLAVTVTPSGKAYYLSNRSGKINLYESNLDGSEPAIVLAGTGSEDDQTGILPSVKNTDYLAIVSSRDGKRDESNNLIHSLYIFKTSSRTLTKIEDTYNFTNYRAWVADALVYEKSNGVSGCSDIKSYIPSTKKSSTLISASGVSACPSIVAPYDDGYLYSLSEGASNVIGTYFGYTNGKTAKRISEVPTDSIIRREKEKISSLHTTYTPSYASNWQTINLENLTVLKLTNGPSETTSRTYNDSTDGKYSTFIEERDGKKELYLTDSNGENEKKLTSLGSVNQFVQWYGNDYVVFSSTKSDENALYVVSIATSKTTKIADFYKANNLTYGGGYNPVY